MRSTVERWGCVNVVALPLQLILRRYPEWAAVPVVVVDDDHPQGNILWVNARARETGIVPGLRYAVGLGLAADLQAEVVTSTEITVYVDSLLTALQHLSPAVGSCEQEPGVFWLDATGLRRSSSSLEQWAGALYTGLQKMGFAATVVAGFTLCELLTKRFFHVSFYDATAGFVPAVPGSLDGSAGHRRRGALTEFSLASPCGDCSRGSLRPATTLF